MIKTGYIPLDFLDTYEKAVDKGVGACVDDLAQNQLSHQQFQYYITASAVASSQIEGSGVDLSSFLATRDQAADNKDIKDIENLILAYEYARKEHFTLNGLLHCHALLSKDFGNLSAAQKGGYRQKTSGVFGYSGPVYMAVEFERVPAEMNRLVADINILLEASLSLHQTLYCASFIHLLFEKIHPFIDGNGRAGRLLEKWFLTEKLGPTAWSIPTERYYWDMRPDYYKHIAIGFDYDETLKHLHKAMPFLLMLPQAVCYKPVG